MQTASRRGQAQALRLALEQRDAELRLQLAQPRGNVRRHAVQLPGRSDQRAATTDREEMAQQLGIESFPGGHGHLDSIKSENRIQYFSLAVFLRQSLR